MEPVYTVRVSRYHGTVIRPERHWPLPGPQMHRLILPEALHWLTQHVGRRAKTRAAFDYHAKFRWWYHLPQPEMDNSAEINWQARAADRYHREQAEFWFKDSDKAMLFRLSFT